MPRLSVLLPCRNAQRFLPECIESLDRQSFRDFEIIAVDDGSTDDTLALLQRWAARAPHVTIVQSGGVGLVDALNAALMRSSGELIARMDADDVADPARFELQVAMLDALPTVAALGTGVRYFPDWDVRDGARSYEAWINSLSAPDQLQADLFVECPIAHPTLMVRRSVISGLRYRDEGWPEDYDLILRIVERGHEIANVPEILLEWREHGDRLSRTDPRYSPDAFRRCKVHFLRRLRLQRRGVIVWGAGPVGKAFARELLEQRIAVHGFIDIDPKKIGQSPNSLRVYAPDDLDVLREHYVVAAVGNPEARRLITQHLAQSGRTELQDFCAVA